ncbi:MAG: prepilin-type N-terminal cleavage/methylation domain-containing protein [Betaproteobacteria bacterium]|nr:MAG: prepilin-type N-terminal cleavage/methylation domain-containing protein [Betaproteobacteria bacterium]
MKSFHRPLRRPRIDQEGFTLIEILIVIAIVGILASIAAPSFNELIKSQRIKSMATDLNSSLTLARSEAIKRNKNVTMSPVTVGSWQDGWQIADPDFAGNIEVHSAFTGLTATGPDSVIYRSSGRIAGAAPSFNISATGTTAQRCVSVDLSGRPYIKAAAC